MELGLPLLLLDLPQRGEWSWLGQTRGQLALLLGHVVNNDKRREGRGRSGNESGQGEVRHLFFFSSIFLRSFGGVVL